MQYVEASTLLKAPEHIRQLLYNSGVYMVNDCFLPLYTEKAFIKDLWGGRGAGRSHHGTDYILYHLMQPDYCRIALLRLSLDSVRDSVFQDLKDRIEEKGLLNEFRITDHTMRVVHKKTGNFAVGKGVKATGGNTAKLKSLAGFTKVLAEEADEIPRDDFRKLSLSIRKKGVEVEIIRMYNPPRKEHYIWDDYTLTPVPEHEGYYTAVPKPNSSILCVNSTYTSNLHNLNDTYIKEIEKYRDSVKFRHDWLTNGLGLISSGNMGLIYSGWKRISLAEYNNVDWNKYYYNDWGTNDPNAIGEVKICKNTIMVKGLHYKPATTIDVAKFLCDKGFTEKDIIICDSSQPDDVIQLRGYNDSDLPPYEFIKRPQLKRGFTTIAVDKPKGSVIAGIRMLKEYDVYIVEDEESEHIWNEYLEYKWDLDKNEQPTDQPTDKNNHHMDGIRYVVYEKDYLFNS